MTLGFFHLIFFLTLFNLAPTFCKAQKQVKSSSRWLQNITYLEEMCFVLIRPLYPDEHDELLMRERKLAISNGVSQMIDNKFSNFSLVRWRTHDVWVFKYFFSLFCSFFFRSTWRTRNTEMKKILLKNWKASKVSATVFMKLRAEFAQQRRCVKVVPWNLCNFTA